MKEFDFDELDKAVSSLVGGKKDQPSDVATSASDDQANTQPTDVPAETPPEEPASKPEIGTEPAEASKPTRRGRFMDLVHPSSDTRRGTMTHEAKTLTPPDEPANKSADTPTTEAEPVPVSETQAAEVKLETPSEEPVSKPDHNWPDPLEVASGSDEKPAEQTALTEVANQPDETNQPTAEQTDDKSESDPTATPFLADAKVEKRPLGAFSDTSTQSEPEKAEEASSPQREAKLETSPVAAEGAPIIEEHASSIPELQKDIVAVESEMVEDKSPQNSFGGSIPPQYKEKSDDKKSSDHAIFDTKEYHTPLPGPVHHGHNVWWIVAAIVILAATAAGFIYWFMFAAK